MTSICFSDTNRNAHDLIVSVWVSPVSSYILKIKYMGWEKNQLELIKEFPQTSFYLIDVAKLDPLNINQNQYLVLLNDNRIGMITEDKHKTWNVVYLSDKEFVTRKDMEVIEELGGLNFHSYILDYDHDGFLDVLLPNRLDSSVGILSCKFERHNRSS